MPTQPYDVAVLGAGSMGAFTCLELARRGLRVLGIDRFSPPHTHGSHSGETRVYREAYAEHPDYVPLALLAGKLWDQYGTEAGEPLLTRCGTLSVGDPASDLLAGVQQSASTHHLTVETLTAAQIRDRYPMIRVHPGEIGLLEPAAGWVDVDRSLPFALNAFTAAGGELRRNTRITRWEPSSQGITLFPESGDSIHAAKLIVCAGAWAGDLLPRLNLPLEVSRKVLFWLRPRDTFAEAAAQMPVTMYTGPILYTFPAKDGLFKGAIHFTDRQSSATDPEHVAPANDHDADQLIDELVAHLQPLFGDHDEARSRLVHAKTCLYTMSPDEHFILDRIPGLPVWYAAGFSGHGFKFAPAIGRVLAEMALGEPTSAPVDFLRSARLSHSPPRH